MLRLTLSCAQVAQASLGMLTSAQVKVAAAHVQNTKTEPAKKKVESDLSGSRGLRWKTKVLI